MSERLGEILSDYVRSRIGVYKKYLFAALNSRDNCLMYLYSSEGTLIPSSDLKNCELLRDAQIFHEDTRISRNGRNSYKIFCLTEFGKRLSEDLREESLVADQIESRQ